METRRNEVDQAGPGDANSGPIFLGNPYYGPDGGGSVRNVFAGTCLVREPFWLVQLRSHAMLRVAEKNCRFQLAAKQIPVKKVHLKNPMKVAANNALKMAPEVKLLTIYGLLHATLKDFHSGRSTWVIGFVSRRITYLGVACGARSRHSGNSYRDCKLQQPRN